MLGKHCTIQRSLTVRTLLLTAWTFLPTALHAQEREKVPQQPSCLECRIELTRVVAIGTADGPGALPAFPHTMARDSRGRYYLAFQRGFMPMIFDARGRFLQEIGRRGEGPGKFRSAEIVDVGPGDTVYVFDRDTGRMTVLSPELEVMRTVIVGYVWDAAILSGARVAVNVGRMDRAGAGLAIHEYDSSGQNIRSYDEYAALATEPVRSVRYLARGSRGLWSVPTAFEYVLTLWDSLGNPILELERDAEWYPPYKEIKSATPDNPTSPMIRGVWEDRDGLVWTLGYLSSVDWARGLGRPVRREGQLFYPAVEGKDVVDGMIEVIDPTTKSLIASQRLPDPITLVVAPNLIATKNEHKDGWYFVEVTRTGIVRGGRGNGKR